MSEDWADSRKALFGVTSDPKVWTSLTFSGAKAAGEPKQLMLGSFALPMQSKLCQPGWLSCSSFIGWSHWQPKVNMKSHQNLMTC